MSSASVIRLGFIGAWILSAHVVTAQTASYDIIELGTFSSDPTMNSNATGLNEHGHVAGLAEDDNGQNHAFLYRDGQLIDLGYLFVGGGYANGKGVNDLDQVVGQANAPAPAGPGFTGRPFVWAEGQGMVDPEPTDLSYGSWCWGINNSGQLAMTLNTGANFWDPVTGLKTITFPNGTGGFIGNAWEINNSGVVCGSAAGSSGFLHSFRYDSATDTLEDLHNPVLWRASEGYGINDNGDIAGWAAQLDNFERPVVWTASGQTIVLPITDLGPAHAYGAAEHINNSGTVVGSDVSFLPEPPIGWVAYDVLNAASPTKIDIRTMLSAEDQLHWTRMHPFEVNEAGQICGTGTVDGKTRAFLMTPVEAWTDLGGGTTGINGTPTLVGSGSLVGGSQASLELSQAAPSALTLAWLSLSSVPVNVLGGTLHATPFNAQFFFTADGLGSLSLSTTWPVGVPPGTDVWFQLVLQDLSSIHGLTLSNGLLATTP